MTEERTTYYVSIKFETTNKAYTFSTTETQLYIGSRVVVETQYGLELGETVSPLRLESTLDPSIEIRPVVRKATEEDIKQYERNKDCCFFIFKFTILRNNIHASNAIFITFVFNLCI